MLKSFQHRAGSGVTSTRTDSPRIIPMRANDRGVLHQQAKPEEKGSVNRQVPPVDDENGPESPF